MCAVKMVQSASQSVKKSSKCSKRGGGGQRRLVKIKLDWLNCALRDDEAVYWVSIGHTYSEK